MTTLVRLVSEILPERSSITPRPLLGRLDIDPDPFMSAASHLLRQFGSTFGTPAHLTARCDARQTRYLRGIAAARKLYPGLAA